MEVGGSAPCSPATFGIKSEDQHSGAEEMMEIASGDRPNPFKTGQNGPEAPTPFNLFGSLFPMKQVGYVLEVEILKKKKKLKVNDPTTLPFDRLAIIDEPDGAARWLADPPFLPSVNAPIWQPSSRRRTPVAL